MNKTELYKAACELYMDPKVRERSFYPQFRTQWVKTFEKAMTLEPYFPEDAADIIIMTRSIDGVEYTFHLSQNKMTEWFIRESQNRKKIVFTAKKLRRDKDKTIRYEDAVCTYDPSLQEKTLTEEDRNIFACAKPGFPPELQIVYGNKWVESRFNSFLQRSIQLFMIQTDYVPAFLCSPFEVCMYLFLMDICIIREDAVTVKDSDLQKLLHIFRPSPMLLVKKLI